MPRIRRCWARTVFDRTDRTPQPLALWVRRSSGPQNPFRLRSSWLRKVWLAAPLIVGFIAVMPTVNASQPGHPEAIIGAPPPLTAAANPNASAEWPSYLHDSGRTGFNYGEFGLNASTAGQLVPVWEFKAGGLIAASP